MGRKKKFIEKSEGVKFYLVHRSQKDPLFLDENLGEHVLVPADDEQHVSQDLIAAVNGIKLGKNNHNRSKTAREREEERLKRVEEQQKYGVYYVDDYDYLQHLKERDDEDDRANLERSDPAEPIRIGSVVIKNENTDDEYTASEPGVSKSTLDSKPKLQLPSSVFPSKYEEEIGYFNQAAPDHDPKINWDPDVVKLLDEDVDIDFDDPENNIDDDFFVRANKNEPLDDQGDHDDNDDDDDEGDGDEDDEDCDSNGRFDYPDYDNDFDDEDDRLETKSRFSEYSMSSSVVHRNEQLKLIDKHFENFFAQYDEDQIGSLDMDDIEGFCNTNNILFDAAIEEFNRLMKKNTLKDEHKRRERTKHGLEVLKEEHESEDEDDDEQNDEETSDQEESNNTSESDDELDENNNKKGYDLLKFSKKKPVEDRFDCESILSTYSTLYNRPTVISERRPPEENSSTIKISKKTGLPIGVLAEKAKTKAELDRLDHQITKVVVETPTRKPNETKEEKRERKQAVKEQRRERRVEKKINKLAFKKEKMSQMSQMSNIQMSAHTIKL